MSKLSKSKAEELFTATQKQDKKFLKEKEQAQQQRAEGVAKLRALRLDKEAADKVVAEQEAAAKASPKKKSWRPPRKQFQ